MISSHYNVSLNADSSLQQSHHLFLAKSILQDITYRRRCDLHRRKHTDINVSRR